MSFSWLLFALGIGHNCKQLDQLNVGFLVLTTESRF
jgi:hypothetical protein